LRRLFALSAAITLNIRLKGLPDSSAPIRQDGPQGQVLAITDYGPDEPMRVRWAGLEHVCSCGSVPR